MTKVSPCVVCAAPLNAPLYATHRGTALTSLGEPIAGNIAVFFCDRCGHAQGAGVAEVAQFYSDDYHILTANADEDDLYEMKDGLPVFRSVHQLATLLAKVDVPQGAQVLDYGCAKAATLKRLVSARADIKGHAFDVSDRYRSFWQAFLLEDAQATFTLPDTWAKKFDVVISFFAFEHIDAPGQALADIRRVIKPGGTVYLIVPNALFNPADLVVIDHVNHFMPPSIEALLRRGGFEALDIDLKAHHGGVVVVARAATSSEPDWLPPAADVEAVRTRVESDCAYWQRLDEGFDRLEQDLRAESFAVYGAGFYGRYIANTLRRPERIACFIDQNPFLRGKTLMGRAIVGPRDLPPGVKDIVVGLNPKVARDIISRVSDLPQNQFHFHYL